MEKNKYTDIDLSKYDAGYQASQAVKDAEAKKNLAESAVTNYGDFQYSNQEAYDNVINQILNRPKFNYDLNGDALYQQYKDQFVTQGKQASADVMGQASALTGGYGNSYAATVGNQTYQGYLQQLNGMIPELYKLALDKYNSEGDQLTQNFGVLSQDRQTAYGEWGDKYNRLVADRDYYATDYDNAYNRDYTTWNDNRTYDTSQYWNEYNTGYQAERDAIADAQWQKDFEEAQRQFNEQMAETIRANQASEEAAWARINAQNDEDEDEDEDTGTDYSTWDAGDWEAYFAQIRQSEGTEAAQAELTEFTNKGLIPKNMTVYAGIGARGKLGH